MSYNGLNKFFICINVFSLNFFNKPSFLRDFEKKSICPLRKTMTIKNNRNYRR